MAATELTALHLCCGAGGSTLGFDVAGIRTALAFDKNAVVLATHRRNLPDAPTAQFDITTLHAGDLPRADVWTCGIPCEAYSMAGQRLEERDVRDISADLVRLLVEARQLGCAPRYVFLENVPPFANSSAAAAIRAALAGYVITDAVYRHADWGVPQMRERWHLLAAPCDPPLHPEPTHAEHPNLLGLPTWRTFASIRERPVANPHYLSARGLRGIMRRQRSKALIAHERRTGAYAAMFVVDDEDLLPTVLASWHKGVSRNQATLIFDDFRYRGPTLLEVRRAQGFPDDFAFCGTVREVHEQVARAVPPPFANAVAAAILTHHRQAEEVQ
jgi:DNA (cytosine-5)-methyltransferase 1